MAEQEDLGERTSEVDFDATGLPSGEYFYCIVAEDTEAGQVQFTSVKKPMLITWGFVRCAMYDAHKKFNIH